MTGHSIAAHRHQRIVSRAARGLLCLRLALVLVITLLMWVALGNVAGVAAFPPETMWATLGLLPVNVVCLVVVRKLYRQHHLTLRQALGIQPGRVGKDLLWGLLWLLVLNVPFGVAVAGMVFLLYGSDAPEAFETIFVNPEAMMPLHPAALLGIALVSVVPFMVLNAPTEELVFRGYGMAGLEPRLGITGAIIVTAVLFGAQHVLFAATLPGMLVFFVAFTVWGVLAAVIVQKQGRLFPVVIAHYLVNIGLSAPAIVFPILQLTGVVEYS